MSWMLYPEKESVDTYYAKDTIYYTAERLVVSGLGSLNQNSEKLFFVGSSNALEGYRPGDFTSQITHHEINNISCNSSNITQIKQIVELVYQQQIEERNASQNVFVLGLWFGSFVEDKRIWEEGRTHIDIEKLKLNLYKETPEGIVPSMGQSLRKPFGLFLRPYYLIENKIVRPAKNFQKDLKPRLLQWIKGEPYAALDNDIELNLRVMNEVAKQKALNYWNNYIEQKDGSFDLEQFEKLVQLSKLIESHNDVLIIVDMPIPHWHEQRSLYFAYYQEHKINLLSNILSNKKVHYVNMQSFNQDLDFYDSSHPKPKTTKSWSDELGPRIREIING